MKILLFGKSALVTNLTLKIDKTVLIVPKIILISTTHSSNVKIVQTIIFSIPKQLDVFNNFSLP